MTWLLDTGTATTAAQTGGQQAAQTAATTGGAATVTGSALNTGAIGQTGITNAMSSTPAYSQFPQQSADLAKFVGDPVGSTYNALRTNLTGSGGSGTGANAGGMSPPQSSGAGGILHGMLSARKTQAPSSGTGEPPPTQARPRLPYQSQDSEQTFAEILAQLFGGR